MNKEQIWEVLQCCLLVTDEVDLDYLAIKGFNHELAKVGIKLYEYLRSR